MEIGCKCWIGDRQFVGHADLIYEIDEASQACGILEFKLNDVEVRSEDVVEKFLQCLLYYMGLPEPFRESCRFASFYVFDTGEQIDREIDEFLLKRAERLVEAALQLADRQDFPPTRNPFCSSCGYQSRCPAYWGENIW
jgi:CRISPR/Cas system-associated exonuclease Cas4 (RecB family)